MEILKKEENGLEFYTIDSTGQSGMSQSSLAILAGVSQPAISQLETTLISKAPSEWLEPFVGKPFTLISNEATINNKPTGNLKIYTSAFCAAVLKHYASPPRTNPTAIISCFKFMEMGIDSWIQGITGWKQRHQAIEPTQPTMSLAVSPWEHIKQTDEDGMEVWSSRQALLLLGQIRHDRLSRHILILMARWKKHSTDPIRWHCQRTEVLGNGGKNRTVFIMSEAFMSVLVHNIPPTPMSKSFIEGAKAYFDARSTQKGLVPISEENRDIFREYWDLQIPMSDPQHVPYSIVVDFAEVRRKVFRMERELETLKQRVKRAR